MRPVFLVGNGLLYTLYTVVSVMAPYLFKHPYGLQFGLCAVFGIFYFVVFMFLAYYGIFISSTAQEETKTIELTDSESSMEPEREPSVPASPKLQQATSRTARIITLLLICGVIIFVHVAYYIFSAMSNFKWEMGYPKNVDDQIWDAGSFFVLECCPTIIIVLTLRSARATQSYAREVVGGDEMGPDKWQDTHMQSYSSHPEMTHYGATSLSAPSTTGGYVVSGRCCPCRKE